MPCRYAHRCTAGRQIGRAPAGDGPGNLLPARISRLDAEDIPGSGGGVAGDGTDFVSIRGECICISYNNAPPADISLIADLMSALVCESFLSFSATVPIVSSLLQKNIIIAQFAIGEKYSSYCVVSLVFTCIPMKVWFIKNRPTELFQFVILWIYRNCK